MKTKHVCFFLVALAFIAGVCFYQLQSAPSPGSAEHSMETNYVEIVDKVIVQDGHGSTGFMVRDSLGRWIFVPSDTTVRDSAKWFRVVTYRDGGRIDYQPIYPEK